MLFLCSSTCDPETDMRLRKETKKRTSNEKESETEKGDQETNIKREGI